MVRAQLYIYSRNYHRAVRFHRTLIRIWEKELSWEVSCSLFELINICLVELVHFPWRLRLVLGTWVDGIYVSKWWSEIPGSTSTLSTRPGFEVQTRSRIFPDEGRVTSRTTWNKEFVSRMSSSFLCTAEELGLVAAWLSQLMSGWLKSPAMWMLGGSFGSPSRKQVSFPIQLG